MRAPIPSERVVQRSIIRMADRCFPDVLMVHVPNGANLKGTAGPLLGDGMRPGFADLLAYWNHGTTLMEVKRPRYSPSDVRPVQVAMHARLAAMGWTVAIVTSPEEAWQHLADRGAPVRARIVA